MQKLFDLRFVIGLFFLVIGILLTVYSFIKADTSINRICGMIFMVFGIAMLMLAKKKNDTD